MEVAGYIVDAETGDGLPGAYAELWSGSVMLKRSAAGANGYFSVSSTGSGNSLAISHVGYTGQAFPVRGSSFDGEYQLQKDYKEEEEVIVESGPRTKRSMGLIILAGLFLLSVLNDRR